MTKSKIGTAVSREVAVVGMLTGSLTPDATVSVPVLSG